MCGINAEYPGPEYPDPFKGFLLRDVPDEDEDEEEDEDEGDAEEDGDDDEDDDDGYSLSVPLRSVMDETRRIRQRR